MASAEKDKNDEQCAKQPADTVVTEGVKRKSWLRRYLSIPTVACILFMLYVFLFGEASVVQRVEYQRVIDSLDRRLEQQYDTLRYYTDLNKRLSTDPELMEQVVREQYNMNRPNEDVYIIK